MSNKKGMVYAIIPARKGSKGIPRKNKRDFCGKPLVTWTIEMALNCKFIDQVFLTTDDPDILEIGNQYEKIVLRNRPKELCEDGVNAWGVTADIINDFVLDDHDILIYLQPTSPLKTVQDIETAYYTFTMFNDCESVISCCRNSKMFYGFKLNQGYLEPLFYHKYLESRRQELPEGFVPNGAIYIINVGTLNFYKTFYTPRTKAYVMPKERSVDLDEEIDWILGEIIWRAKHND